MRSKSVGQRGYDISKFYPTEKIMLLRVCQNNKKFCKKVSNWNKMKIIYFFPQNIYVIHFCLAKQYRLKEFELKEHFTM